MTIRCALVVLLLLLLRLSAYQEYATFESPAMKIVASDLGKSVMPGSGADADGDGGNHMAMQDEWEWVKEYEGDYVYGQLIFWFKHTLPAPGKTLRGLRRGCLVLPDPSCCYSRNPLQPLSRGYGQQQRNSLVSRMVS